MTSPSVTLLLVRHGRTSWNEQRRIQGQLDSALDDVGHEQARLVGLRLAEEPFQALYSSDLKRTMDTAAPLAELLDMPIHPDPMFREWHLGDLQGWRYEEAHQHFRETFQRFSRFDPDAEIPGGESFHGFYDRCVNGVETLAGKHPGGYLAVFTHGGVINCCLRKATGVPITEKIRFHVENTALTRIKLDLGQQPQWHLLETEATQAS